MRADRMMTILVTLLRRGRVQAKELAEMLDVSLRTVYRDIEAINQAGIPVIAWQGANGGFEIAEGFRLDSGVFSSHELAAMVTALTSVSASVADKKMAALAEKLQSVVPVSHTEAFNLESQQLFIDFTPWSMDKNLQQSIILLRQAIGECRLIEFVYQDVHGNEACRRCEPHTLVLKGQNWYLYAFCLLREDFRLFRVSRVRQCRILDQGFIRRPINIAQLPWNDDFASLAPKVPVRLRFFPEAWKVAREWVSPEAVQLNNDGSADVSFAIPENNWLYGLILSYGPGIEVLEPMGLRQRIANIASDIVQLYQTSDKK